MLWWQNHFGITLSQLLEHRYHVMHIRLTDKHNVAHHFCLQVFLSEQSFPSLSIMSCCSSTVFCYFSRLAASSNFVMAVDIVSGFFLPADFVHDSDYFPLQSFNWYLIKRGVLFQKSYHSTPMMSRTNFRNTLPFYLIYR